MSDKQIEEGLENFPKPNATPVEPLATVELEPEQKVVAPTGKEKAKRPADNDNPQGMNEEEEIVVDDSEESKVVLEQEAPKFELAEDLGGLLESLELPAEFKEKALTIFEATVTAQISDMHKAMMAENVVKMEEYKQALSEKMEEKVNVYMTESVAKWVEDNQVVVKSNIRTQIAESFMANLVELLETHYITVPENKEDILEASLEKNEKLEKALAEEVETVSKLKAEIFEANKSAVLESALAGMSDVDKDRMKTLAESITDLNIETYKTKLETIKESFTGEVVQPSTFVTEDVNGEVETAPIVEAEVAKPSQYSYIQNLANKLI